MNKKGIIGLVIAIVIIIIAIVSFVLYYQNDITEENNLNGVENTESENTDMNITNEENDGNKEVSSNQNKTLVVYYSAQTHTKAVAEKIAKNLNADIFEIVPEEIYTSEDLNWTNNNSRVSKEHNDESLRNVKLVTERVENWEDYDTILIGYPIWWGIAAWPVDNFVKENDFTGKTVIPFCTAATSGIGDSGNLLEEMTGTGDWKEGERFHGGASESDISSWIDSLGL